MSEPSGFEAISGSLALDFVNTVANRGNPEKRRELLRSPADLARWFRTVGLPEIIIPATRLGEAIAIRERLFALFHPIAGGGSIGKAAFAAFGEDLRAAEAERRICYEDGRVSWGWASEATSLHKATYPVLAEAASLLLSLERTRIGECKGPGCGWLFVDHSRGKPRKWCSMSDCGNKAKAQRAYRRRTEK
ncbi:CGNR zinc finger domain-containing protein [Luteimonas aquatica]|uniref:CGNR zinc finger domain-containing protein n=1 Tax=Luteimonas aquatica TaxID=450364 RepID=UPI001F561213|nr:ABATE domain-containing protein [Luteimonas aquatica]